MSASDAALPADDFRGYGGEAESSPPALHALPRVVVSAPGAAHSNAAHAADAALLTRARDGDRAAFGALVERHHRSLAAILRPRCGPAVPMEDLLQEVFARALAHVGDFRGGSSFLTWATSIGLHLASDWRRTDVRHRRLAPPAAVTEPEPPCRDAARAAHAVETRDAVDRARHALDQLPEPMRIAVTLRVVEDEDYETIAERMQAPLPRVRQWVCRGLKRLREALEDCHEGA